jgi:hypothetical protein
MLMELGLGRRDQPVPICALCGTPVQRMQCAYDPLEETIVYTVFCHGQSETARLDRETVEDSISISGGLAFAKPQIGARQ